jgi:hypothetical protein
VNKAMWLIDRCPVGKRHERADAGHGHQAPTNRVIAN